jgi:Tol biopolymer transport system component
MTAGVSCLPEEQSTKGCVRRRSQRRWRAGELTTADAGPITTTSRPNWTPDSRSVYFSSDRTGTFDIFRQELDRRTADAIISGPDDETGPTAVSPDGAWLYFFVITEGLAAEARRGGSTVMRTAAAGGARDKIAEGSQVPIVVCARPPSTACVLVQHEGPRLIVYGL